MHITVFILKDGKKIYDYIKKVDIKGKRVLLWDKQIWIKFNELASAVTEGERVNVHEIKDFDELPRWNKEGERYEN